MLDQAIALTEAGLGVDKSPPLQFPDGFPSRTLAAEAAGSDGFHPRETGLLFAGAALQIAVNSQLNRFEPVVKHGVAHLEKLLVQDAHGLFPPLITKTPPSKVGAVFIFTNKRFMWYNCSCRRWVDVTSEIQNF